MNYKWAQICIEGCAVGSEPCFSFLFYALRDAAWIDLWIVLALCCAEEIYLR